MASDPSTCTNTCMTAHAYCPRAIKLTPSAEKVENVVNPPSMPVMTNSLTSGETEGNKANDPIANPMR